MSTSDKKKIVTVLYEAVGMMMNEVFDVNIDELSLDVMARMEDKLDEHLSKLNGNSMMDVTMAFRILDDLVDYLKVKLAESVTVVLKDTQASN